MMLRFLLVLILASVAALAADPPSWQLRVERLVWVVSDPSAVVAQWRNLGLLEAMPAQTISPTLHFRGDPVKAKLRWQVARFGDTIVDFVQPLEGVNAFSAFHKRHKDGILALVHRVDSMAALESEIARMKEAGVAMLQDSRVESAGARARMVLFDTEAEGKYSLGLIATEGERYPKLLEPPPLKPEARKVTQYAFAVKNLDTVSAYWQKLGWPVMAVTNPDLLELTYRGKPERFAMKLGWYRHAKVPYEWILSTQPPNVYEDHMRVHGEGIHHLALNVPDMDAAIQDWERKGYLVSQSGAWGEKGKPGSGRFAYLDTQKNGGIDIELLWNYRAPDAN